MTQVRKTQIDLNTTPHYHSYSRCIRRAFLCGIDPLTEKSFDHRKQWLADRLALLGQNLSIIIGYKMDKYWSTFMGNKPKKTEVRVAIDSNFLKKLENRLGLTKSTDLTRVALSLLDWVSEETKEGRMILSTNKDGKNAHRLVMPELANIKPSK